tara:strand:+ start:521 stop:1015 length:495 start_codon:yes stop_codon:yes gene_type:complete
MIVWIVGLAGSGKTTIGQSLYKEIKKKNSSTCFIDGDKIRQINDNDLGYTLSDRKKNAKRIINFCKLLDDQKINVIVSILHNFPKQGLENRKKFSKYVEIFIECKRKTLIKRNQKKLYSKGNKGRVKNVVGIDIKFNKPIKPDLTINCEHSRKTNLKKILKVLK